MTENEKMAARQSKLFWDAVGRPRKLSNGAMLSMMDDFAHGATTRQLAEAYGVSTSLVRVVCYHTRILPKEEW